MHFSTSEIAIAMNTCYLIERLVNLPFLLTPLKYRLHSKIIEFNKQCNAV